MDDKSKNFVQAGLWYRVCAIWLDLLVVYVIMRLIAEAANMAGIYIPHELTFVLIFMSYAIFFTLWIGKTPGKALCSLSVKLQSKGIAGYIRIVLRETLGKIVTISTCFLAIAIFFLWKAFSLQKHIPFGMLIPMLLVLLGIIAAIILQRHKAIHDRIGNTVVFRQKGVKGISRYGVYIASILLTIFLLSYAHSWYTTGQISSYMSVKPDYVLPSHNRASEDLIEITALNDEKKLLMAGWLDDFGSTPLDYIIKKALQYQLLIFGEEHEQKETLQLFNKMLPILYEKANVTCIGMETFLAKENQAVEKLVTAQKFDHQQALKLARRMDKWGVWGFKEYWQVMETVWQINQTIPTGKPKVKIIGLGVPIDVMSFSMAGFEPGPGSHTSLWEKLRMIRILPDLPNMISRDALMANEAMNNIMEKGQKGVILVGAAHSTIRCPMPGRANGTKVRMGFMLAQKYPNKVFQIVFHRHFISESAQVKLDEVIENIMANRNHQPVGFDVENSPFSLLRDSTNWMFSDSRLELGDLATGYIYLAPLEKIHRCDWMKGYISQSMYLENKPFYKSCGIHFNKNIENAKDVNSMFVNLE